MEIIKRGRGPSPNAYQGSTHLLSSILALPYILMYVVRRALCVRIG